LEDAECIIGNHIRDVARMAVTQSLAGSTRRRRQSMPTAPRRWSTSAREIEIDDDAAPMMPRD
jgi:hypothetical protein